MSELFIARKGDKHDCPLHGEGTLITGFANYLVEGQPVARVGDEIRCPDGSTAEILDNDCCMEIGGQKVARLGDITSHGGKIISAASTTIAKSNNTFIHVSEKTKVVVGKNVIFGNQVNVKTNLDNFDDSYSQTHASLSSNSDAIKPNEESSFGQTEKNMWAETEVAIRGKKFELITSAREYIVNVSNSLDATLKLVNKNSVNPISFDKEGFKIEAKNEAAGICSRFKIKNPQSILDNPSTLTLYNNYGEYHVALTPVLITDNIKKYDGTISKEVSINEGSWVIKGELDLNITIILSKSSSEDVGEKSLAYELQYNLDQIKSALVALASNAELILEEVLAGVIFAMTVGFIAIDSI